MFGPWHLRVDEYNKRDKNYESAYGAPCRSEQSKKKKNLAEIATISFALISGNFLTLMVDRH